jgi:4-hydroxy-tetrahydrodipicolinate synthase
VVTPFQDDARESLDLDSLRRSIAFFQRTCQGVTITGVLGESNRMTDKEREQVIHVARDTIMEGVADSTRSPFTLCVGTSYSGTAATVALSQTAKESGADAVMVSPSKEHTGAQPSDDDILELYRRVAEACGPDLDIVLQDLPSSTGVYLSLELMARIVTEIPSVRCIKLESLPTVYRLQALKRNHPQILQHCSILTGLGALYAGFDLEQGITSGFMTGFSFPEILLAMNSYAQAEDFDKAHLLYRKFLPLLVLEQQPVGGLAIRKEIYKLRGLIDSSHVRHPGKNISKSLQQVLQAELERSLPGIDLFQPIPKEVLEV